MLIATPAVFLGSRRAGFSSWAPLTSVPWRATRDFGGREDARFSDRRSFLCRRAPNMRGAGGREGLFVAAAVAAIVALGLTSSPSARAIKDVLKGNFITLAAPPTPVAPKDHQTDLLQDVRPCEFQTVSYPPDPVPSKSDDHRRPRLPPLPSSSCFHPSLLNWTTPEKLAQLPRAVLPTHGHRISAFAAPRSRRRKT